MKTVALPRLLCALTAMVALPFFLTGCSDTDNDVAPYWQSDEPPPAPQFETRPELDPRTQIWIPGYWGLSNAKFYWVSGKVIARPDPTAVWDAARWVHHMYGWSFQQGHWE
ncbi:MAG: YXWGXW repeat-containing protein [Alphaproteobacteria bacterium]|nr:YXWGXW repeat-containing protein [Alphaproteobacteria bacterium]